MDKADVLGILDTGSLELNTLRENLDLLIDFLHLIESIDQLAGMDRRVSKEGLSLYHAVSKEIEIAELEKILSRFFGDPVKKSGEPLPSSLTENSTVQHLGGVQEEQILFLSKIGQGELYGALFPWQRKVNVVTVHLGYWNSAIPEDDYQKLGAILNEWISQAVSQQIEEQVTGKVQGISLPSFLQMSEMEGSTCSLRIHAGERTGMLHLLNGNLIDAETGDLKHIDAAYAIISWDDPAIEILKAVGRKKNEIKMPLMSILMEALRRKDTLEYEKDAPREKTAEPDLKIEAASAKKTTEPVLEEKKAPDKAAGKPASSAEEADTELTTLEMEEVPPITPEAPVAEEAEDAVAPELEIEKETEAAPAPAGEPIGKPPEEPKDEDVSIDLDLIDPKEVAEKKQTERKAAMVVKPKKKTPVLAILVAAVVILGAGGFFIFKSMQGPSPEKNFDTVLAQLATLQNPLEKEKLLEEFINTHEGGEDTARAEQKLMEVWQEAEEFNYQHTIDEVNKLPFDGEYEHKATALYNDFLEKYPDSRYRGEIKEAITQITAMADDIHFGELKNIAKDQYIKRIQAYEAYLAKRPHGKHRDDVTQLIKESLGGSFFDFNKRIKSCQNRKEWSRCVEICDEYMANFKKYLDVNEVHVTRQKMLEQRDYDILLKEVVALNDEAARKVYSSYMQRYPDSPHNKEIRASLKRMDQKALVGVEWEKLKAKINRTIDPSIKIDMLFSYMKENSDSPFNEEAKALIKEFETEIEERASQRAQTARDKQEEDRKKKAEALRKAEAEKEQKERTRLEDEKRKMIGALAGSKRFNVGKDGIVIDKKTGLMWSLLDSEAELDKCLNYRSAARYVKEMQHGGYTDWRLPTSAELAGIYKNSPYFPSTGADWYWTSEAFAKGYNNLANTVTSKHETTFKKIPVDVYECGVVRAVRP